MSPFNAWVLLKGLETLRLRVDAGCAAAAAVADALAGHPAVHRVLYPTRADHPQHALAMAQMSGRRHDGDVRAGGQGGGVLAMNAFELMAVSNNLGDSKSLATHPATTTHMRIGAEERARLGISDGVIRLSVGLEDEDDLVEDLLQALDRIGQPVRAGRRVDAAMSYAATTRGIEVTVEPVFLEDQSDPGQPLGSGPTRCGSEHGRETVQLLRRTWRITDAHGRTQVVRGEGVVGEQPLLEPGESFEYTSGTPLDTPSGFMSGTYHMVVPQTGEPFDVAIPAFSLDSPGPGRQLH